MSSLNLREIYRPVADQIAAVESILRDELSSQTPWVDQLLEHSWLLGGKRMRPAFVLLTAGHLGEVLPAHRCLAAALEMIHTATLVHDDILDDADTRRHQPTANAKWGNKVSVLLGDYLFTHAFHVASRCGSADAIGLLAASSNRVCEGEIRQNAWRANFELTEADYIAMVSDKTAELCACACEAAALLSGADSVLQSRFREYGLNLGIAFQIIDDVLDVVGHDKTVGKTLGTDLLNRKPTLPVIHCLAENEPKSRERLLAELSADSPNEAIVRGCFQETMSIDYARSVAHSYAMKASDFATSLQSNRYSESLISITEFVLQRLR